MELRLLNSSKMFGIHCSHKPANPIFLPDNIDAKSTVVISVQFTPFYYLLRVHDGAGAEPRCRTKTKSKNCSDKLRYSRNPGNTYTRWKKYGAGTVSDTRRNAITAVIRILRNTYMWWKTISVLVLRATRRMSCVLGNRTKKLSSLKFKTFTLAYKM